jgi:hypothetical protein
MLLVFKSPVPIYYKRYYKTSFCSDMRAILYQYARLTREDKDTASHVVQPVVHWTSYSNGSTPFTERDLIFGSCELGWHFQEDPIIICLARTCDAELRSFSASANRTSCLSARFNYSCPRSRPRVRRTNTAPIRG